MSKIFYDHLVQIEEIYLELDKHDLPKENRDELASLIDETTHHRILDTILTHLPQEKHQTFLEKFHASPHDQKLLTYLKSEIAADIEEKIKTEGRKLKAELLAEIKRAKR